MFDTRCDDAIYNVGDNGDSLARRCGVAWPNQLATFAVIMCISARSSIL